MAADLSAEGVKWF